PENLLWRKIDLKKNNLILSVFLCFGMLASSFPVFSQDSVNFRQFLEERLAKSKRQVVENGRQRVITGIKLSEVCDVDNDKVAERVFADYGAIFISGNGVLFPTRCVFQNENQVQFYQSNARPKSANVGGVTIELQ